MTLEQQIAEAIAQAPSYHAFLGALIGGAVSLIGGLAGRSAAKKKDKAAAEAAKVPQVTKTTHEPTFSRTDTVSTTANGVDIDRMMADAERAGFNPVTFLNAGGLGAYSFSASASSQGMETRPGKSVSVTTGHNAMAAVPTAPSFGQVLAGAAQSGFDIYRQDKQIADQRAYETGLLDMQMGGRSGGTSFLPTGRKVAGSYAFGSSPMGAPTVPVVGETNLTNPYNYFHIDPTQRDAAAVEERYGDVEPITWGFGVKRLWDDFFYNVTGETVVERGERTAAKWDAIGGPKVGWSTGPQPGYGSTLFDSLGITIRSKAPAPQPQSSGGGGW